MQPQCLDVREALGHSKLPVYSGISQHKNCDRSNAKVTRFFANSWAMLPNIFLAFTPSDPFIARYQFDFQI